MDELLNWLWQGSVVALGAAVWLRVAARARAGHRYAICGVALAMVLALPLLPLVPAHQPVVEPGAAPLTASIALVPGWWTSTSLLGTLWALWIAAHGLRLAGAFAAVRRIRRASVPMPARFEARLPRWRDASAHGAKAPLVLSTEIGTAAVIGAGSPTIAVSANLVEGLTDEQLDQVVLHEWAHVQRRDHLLNLAHHGARMLAGWHPAVWWLERQMQIEREAACDEMVVSLTGCAKKYAAALAAAAGAAAAARNAALPVPGMLHAPALRQRIERLLGSAALISPGRSSRSAAAASLLLAALALAVARVPVIGFAADLTSPPRVTSDAAPAVGSGAEAERMPALEDVAASVAESPASPAKRWARTSARPGTAAGVRTGRFAAGAQGAPVLSAAGPAPARTTEARRLPVDHFASLPAGGGRARGIMREPERGGASPWASAAGAGAAIARGSERAATSTAGAFSRFGRRIAASF